MPEFREREMAETLAAASLVVAQSEDLDSTLDRLLDYLHRLVPSDTSTVFLLNDDSTLSVAAMRGHEKWTDPELVRTLTFDPRKKPLLAQLLGERKPIVIADTALEPSWEHPSAGEYIRSWLGVPLVLRDQAIGLYSLDKTEPGFFNEEHVRLAVSLAPMAASAVGVARLVRHLREAAEFSRQTEQALRQSEARYRSLFEGAPDGILVADSAGTYVDANPSALVMLGYARDELVGMTSQEILSPKEHLRVDPALTDINRGIEHRREWQLKRKDGSVFDADVMATAMADGRILALIRDVSDRKRMEEELRQSQKMDAVGRLAGGIAHDFNNLLGVIIGYGEMLVSTTPQDHPDRRRIEQMVRAAERGAGLTRQLLAFSRKQVLEPKVLEPSAVVKDMRRLLQPLIGEHIELALKAKARGRVKVDPGQLEQVVMNLVVNARDAMPTGGTLTIETADVDLDGEYVQHREMGLKPGRYVSIAVADTGVGMDEATQARVFEPFFTTKAEGKGTGLGLATVYGIITQSEGHIWVYSEVGSGSVFRVYLPRVEEEMAREQRRPLVPHRSATETVLVVEDEPAALELVAEILRAEGYSVLLAANGQEAVDLATRAQSPIHMLLTDVVLPKLGGRAAAERIRAIHPAIKVLYMSGYTDDEVSRQGVLEPGIVLLQKPFTPDDMVRRVGEVLDGG